MNKAGTDIQQLRNVGPKLAAKMLAAGIDSPDKLRELGARNAYLMMYEKGDAYGDFNAAYLYALEGAILDCDWSDIPTGTRNELRAFAQALQRKSKAND